MVPILLAVAVLSMSYPYGFPLFGPLSFIFFCYLVITKRAKININLTFIIFISISMYYILGILLSGGELYNNVISDVLNIISLIFTWIVISSMPPDDKDLIINRSAKTLIAIGTIVSLLALHKFYLLTGGIEISRYASGSFYPDGTSLVRDRNMFGMALLLTLFMSVYKFKNSISFLPIAFYFSSTILISTTIIFTGSRRSWIAMALIMVVFIFALMSYTKYIKRNIKPVFFVLITIVLLVIPIFLIVTILPNQMTDAATNQFDRMSYRFSTINLTDSEELTSPRTDRWSYAMEVYSQQPLFNQLFGSGFEYLDLYSQQFGNQNEDFPHNPILSALLYSGIVGAILLLTFYIVSIVKILNSRKNLNSYLVIFYFLSYLFIMVSSNSVFSNALFLLITFLLVSQKENTRRI